MDKPKLCPICGGEPEIDTGFTDAPYETPLVICGTWHFKGDLTARCPMHADGVDAWNFLCERAEKYRTDALQALFAEMVRAGLEMSEYIALGYGSVACDPDMAEAIRATDDTAIAEAVAQVLGKGE